MQRSDLDHHHGAAITYLSPTLRSSFFALTVLKSLGPHVCLSFLADRIYPAGIAASPLFFVATGSVTLSIGVQTPLLSR